MKLTYKVFLLGLLFPAVLSGQETGLLRIIPDRPAHEGEAALWGGVEDGRFKPTYAAQFQWSAGADAKIARHGKKASWTGAISFGQTVGRQMYSSMLLNPGYFPFDILEFTKGTKSRQDVSLEAGFLTDLGYEWAAGFEASVKGAHVGKQQDVHHTSFGLDAKVAPVLTYVMDDEMGLVSSYFGRLQMETLKAAEDGGDLFLDEGLRYGTFQALGGNGMFPVRELSHGFSELLYSPEVSIGFDIAWKRGQAGGKDYRQFRFPGSTISVFARHTILADKADHVYGASYSRMRDQLRQNLESGPQAMSDRNRRHLELMYEARFVSGILKKTGITLDGNFWTERSWLGGDQTQRYDGTAVAHAAFSYGVFDLDLSVQGGNGLWKDPGKTGQVNDYRPEQPSEEWLRQMDYYLAKRIGCGGTLTGRVSSSLYVQLYAYWHYGIDATLLGGKNREIATLKVGYKF